MEKIYLGSHVSLKSPDYYLGSVKEAISFNENTFMIYTGAPQNSFRLPISKLKVEEARALLSKEGFDESKIIVHAPYIINLANNLNVNNYHFAIDKLLDEVKRTNALHLKTLVLHPGNRLTLSKEEAIQSIASGINEVFSRDKSDVKIALETMAGKGTEMGTSFSELKAIIDLIEDKSRIGVCLDTCHISDSGIDVKDVDGVIESFDKIIGLDKLLCLHINDSKNVQGAKKDRHENIGFGEIGFETLFKFVHHPKLIGKPMCLETPYINGVAPYKKEVAMLLSGDFDPSWRDNF